MGVEVPHFDLPLRLADGKFGVVEQDSTDDVANCVEVLASTGRGALYDQPTFGIPKPEFQSPVSAGEIDDALREWEPRYTGSLSDVTDAYEMVGDGFVTRLRGIVSAGG